MQFIVVLMITWDKYWFDSRCIKSMPIFTYRRPVYSETYTGMLTKPSSRRSKLFFLNYRLNWWKVNHRCLYFWLHCDLVWIPRLFVVEVVAMLYLLDLIGFDSNGLLSRVLSAQRPRWRRSMVDEILLQLEKTEMFTIHLQRIGR